LSTFRVRDATVESTARRCGDLGDLGDFGHFGHFGRFNLAS
jgi:hypothetical protein